MVVKTGIVDREFNQSEATLCSSPGSVETSGSFQLSSSPPQPPLASSPSISQQRQPSSRHRTPFEQGEVDNVSGQQPSTYHNYHSHHDNRSISQPTIMGSMVPVLILPVRPSGADAGPPATATSLPTITINSTSSTTDMNPSNMSSFLSPSSRYQQHYHHRSQHQQQKKQEVEQQFQEHELVQKRLRYNLANAAGNPSLVSVNTLTNTSDQATISSFEEDEEEEKEKEQEQEQAQEHENPDNYRRTRQACIFLSQEPTTRSGHGNKENYQQQQQQQQERDNIHCNDHNNLSPPLPTTDSGWRAWMVVLASVMIQTFAFAPTEFIFGVFQQEYLHIYLPAGATAPSVALIGTIGTSTTYLVGFLSGAFSDRWGYRVTSCAGTVIMTLALVLASFSSQLWHLYLSQGLLFGIGSSLVYFSSVAAPSHWFNKRRGLAMGIAASGSGIGGFYLAPLAQYLIDHVGISWTLRILALYGLVVCGGASLLLFERPSMTTTTNKTSLKAVSFHIPQFSKEIVFIFLVAFQFFMSMGYLTPIYFMECPELVSNVLGIVYGCSTVALFSGSLISGHLLDVKTMLPKYLSIIMYSGGMFGAAAICATAWVVLMRRKNAKVNCTK
ncbi:hypothetical protein BG004_006158 [Podila humilis]|nr:hypothetical protein BG004_006158 [Podila humilis]